MASSWLSLFTRRKGDKKAIKNRLVLFFARDESDEEGDEAEKMGKKISKKKAEEEEGKPINDREIVANAKFCGTPPERLKLKALIPFDTKYRTPLSPSLDHLFIHHSSR